MLKSVCSYIYIINIYKNKYILFSYNNKIRHFRLKTNEK